jgi:hypothetical protein
MNIKLILNNFKFLNELITLNNGFNRTIAVMIQQHGFNRYNL